MRYFERKRRTSIKEHYVSGVPKSVSGNGSVEIISSSGAPFKSLKISGKTKQLSNQISKHYDYFTNLDNYIFGDVGYTFLIPFPDEWIGKELTFSLKEKSKMENISFELADGVGLFANTERLLDYNGNIKRATSDKYTYFRFTAILTAEKTEISDFWNNYSVCVVGKDEDFPTPIQPTLEFPQPIVNAGEGGLSIVINGKELSIPTSVVVDGKEIPLLFSEYDKIHIDGAKRKVIYSQGSFVKTYKGSEEFYINGYPESAGYGKHFIHSTDYEIKNGYCTHFRRSGWLTEKNATNIYSLVLVTGTKYRFAFKTDGNLETTASEFKDSLKELYEKGSPVTIIAQRYTPIESDITSTDLGQALLSLCMARGESGTLEVKGALEEIPIELTYYSSEVEDVVNITIKYTNQSGADICEPRVESVRQGSKYLIVAPHIDGYKRVSTEVFGVADEDATIELIYK